MSPSAPQPGDILKVKSGACGAAGALRRRALRLGAPARHGHATLFGWFQISPARSLGRWFWTYRRRWQPARPQVAPMRTFEPGGASGHPHPLWVGELAVAARWWNRLRAGLIL